MKKEFELSKNNITPDLERGLLAGLNQAQHDAVTHGNGPLLVVAGAGTGKTNVLTKRIAWLIETGKANASEVLALTFTEKAASEMEHRTDVLLPLGVTETWIHTFHSFGRRMLEEESLLAGLPPDFTVMNEAEQQVFLGDRMQLLHELKHFRPLGNPYKFVEPIVKLISRAKDELISPADYAGYAEQLEASANDEATQEAALAAKELARIYQAYEDWKHEALVVDYGDLIARIIELTRTNASVRERLKKRFKYVLVDEFQDTNVAQYELVKILLSDEQNLTVVGDDDQAIYKFRGAAVSNILGFLNDFPNSKQLVLAENYRSTQQILDAAYTAIQNNNPDRLEAKLNINKRLVAKCESSQGEPVSFNFFQTEQDELKWIVDAVKTEQEKGIPLNEIAILARANAQLDDVARVLTIANIPVQTPSDRHFLYQPEIRGVMAFLKVLAHPTYSLDLLKLALSPYYNANPEWLLLMNDAVRSRNQSFHEVLQDDTRPPWHVLPEEGRALMLRLRDDLARYRRMIASRNVWEILYEFLREHDALKLETEADNLRVANLAKIFEAIKAYSRAGRDPHTLSFVDHLDQLVGTLNSPTNDLGPDQTAVNLMTVHAAKGLEFNTVILPSLVQGRFPGVSRHDVLELPTELIKEQLPTGDEHIEEERRLFYVAVTRAKQTLRLSAAERYGSGARLRKKSNFIAEALGETNSTAETFDKNTMAALFQFAPLARASTPLRYSEPNGVLTLSPAKIDSYLKCPNEFYWRYVLNAPGVASPVLTYGNAVHAGIERFHRLRRDGMTDADLLTQSVLEGFHDAWNEEGFASQEQAREMLVRGENTLSRFVEKTVGEPQPTRFESWFHLTLPNSIEVRGRIDALYLDGEIEIRDYKTSESVANEAAAKRKAKNNVPITIYGLAIKRETGRTPSRLVLDFVETNQLGIIVPTDEQLENVASLINKAAEGIRAGSFEPNPAQHFCDICGRL